MVPCIARHLAAHDGEVGLLHAAVLEEILEQALVLERARAQQEAAGLAIESMRDARSVLVRRRSLAG